MLKYYLTYQNIDLYLFYALTAILWYYFIYQDDKRTIWRLVVFPVSSFRKLLFSSANPEIIPIAFGYLLFITSALYDLVWKNHIVYLLNWTLVLLFECHIVSQSLFRIDRFYKTIGYLLIFIVLAGFSIYKAISLNNYQPMNQFDFVVLVYMFLGSIICLVRLVRRNRFEEDLTAFFVFYGLSAYAFLLILATIAQALDIIGNFYFTSIISRLTLTFWILNILWIRRLKLSLMS
jgi:hypothetical protein